MSRLKRTYKNYEIYENCEINDNSQDHWQNQQNLFKMLQGSPFKVTIIAKTTKFTKTAKFTIIHHTTYKINEIYSQGCKEGPSKVTEITKITTFTKTAKFTIIRRTTYKINKM